MLDIKGVSNAGHKGSHKCWAQRESQMLGVRESQLLGIKGVSNAGCKGSLKCWA